MISNIVDCNKSKTFYFYKRDLRLSPLGKNTPESAEAFAKKAFALMPHVKITELQT